VAAELRYADLRPRFSVDKYRKRLSRQSLAPSLSL
jgi:hypothetical protein